jgi:hypothetical protein
MGKRKSSECISLMKRSKPESISGDTFMIEHIQLHQNYLHEIGLRISSMMDSIEYDEICNYEQGIKLLCMGIELKLKDNSTKFHANNQIIELKNAAFDMLDLIQYLKTYVVQNK